MLPCALWACCDGFWARVLWSVVDNLSAVKEFAIAPEEILAAVAGAFFSMIFMKGSHVSLGSSSFMRMLVVVLGLHPMFGIGDSRRIAISAKLSCNHLGGVRFFNEGYAVVSAFMILSRCSMWCFSNRAHAPSREGS